MRVYVLVLVALLGCKKKLRGPEPGEALAKMAEFKDQMCACKAGDKACADRVQEDLTKWSTDMAAKAADRKEPKVDEAAMKKMTEIGQAYGECMTKAMEPEPPAPVQPPAPPAPVQAPAPLLPTPINSQADALLRQAREWVAKERPQRYVSRVKLSYVDAKGILDPVYGAIDVRFGRIDDSLAKRRVGTPVKPRVAYDDCLALGTSGGRWILQDFPCADTFEYAPRCNVQSIWKRASTKRTYDDAVAVITFDVPTKTWEFTIDDEPSNLHVKELFPDDCPLQVER